ncbi:hypothetical protein [Novilysobacter spongiicola]|uniref:Uncharacterized protein n=1 Tax=Lysobacter spongiicola DSM 21749 TaxID=1122188 RepID=A0A1T4RFM3_9GAMM|nr:hypothetical protein [Lysobacter spongiicola]SKA14794.1 hypothetical protein SAMN02745674_02163 [Lysobacter spongiicola DSM 21749]
MKLPAHAFAEISPMDVLPGQLFKFRGGWALRVTYREATQGFLMLSGERAGWVHEIAAGMSAVIAIVPAFGWFPLVEDETPTTDALLTSTLMLTEAGPAICGVGQEVDGPHRVRRYEQWSAELFHESRPFVSLGTLLEVDRRGQQR